MFGKMRDVCSAGFFCPGKGFAKKQYVTLRMPEHLSRFVESA